MASMRQWQDVNRHELISFRAHVAGVLGRASEEKVTVMRATFHGELAELITDLPG